jgi:hypothetical protein
MGFGCTGGRGCGVFGWGRVYINVLCLVCACIFEGGCWPIMFQTKIHRKVLLPKIFNILKIKFELDDGMHSFGLRIGAKSMQGAQK